uniref:Uncharacterized protein n=1 Tax=Romanomermis culicivorax TaxID=13658 RepID=A0A915IRX5_ROMCU
MEMNNKTHGSCSTEDYCKSLLRSSCNSNWLDWVKMEVKFIARLLEECENFTNAPAAIDAIELRFSRMSKPPHSHDKRSKQPDMAAQCPKG